MLKNKYLLTIMILLSFLATACYYDSEEVLYSRVSTTCNLESVTFTSTIKPILQSSCYSCHSNSNSSKSGGGITLENYGDVQIQARNGKLMGTVRHASGFQAMPKDGRKLTDCEINQLQKWIDNGALNN